VPVQAVEQQSFGPEDIEILSNAFEEAVRELRLVDRTDPATQLVAKRIIELAQQGERDPIRLREGAVKATTVAVAASLLLSDPVRSATAPFHPSRASRRQ
jgi:hypothetical protein